MEISPPIYTERNECQDCFKCVRECPVKAIKIGNSCANIIQEACLACGYDEAAGACVCKTPAGEARRVATAPKEAFGTDDGSLGAGRGKPKRMGETLVFPGLIAEAEAESAKAKVLDWKRQLAEQKAEGKA